MKIQESKEMYLETILVLMRRGMQVRSIDIANEMKFSKPSVSRAVGILKSEQLILIDSHGIITLTKEGRKLAEKILERHYILKVLLMHMNIAENIADDDACRIEHVISDETFEAMKLFVNKEVLVNN
jgi:Mn-dependent transcriptional regulator